MDRLGSLDRFEYFKRNVLARQSIEQARAAGWDAEGVEPSRWAASYARDQLHLPVREGTLESAGYTKVFDLGPMSRW